MNRWFWILSIASLAVARCGERFDAVRQRELARWKRERVVRSSLDVGQLEGKSVSVSRVERYKRWLAVLDAPKTGLAVVEFDAGMLRAIAEIRVPETPEEKARQQARISALTGEGYNGGLVVWRGEDVNELVSTVQWAKSIGLTVLLTWGPEEGKDGVVYPDMQVLRVGFNLALPSCDAVVLLWRKSSGPHFQGDNAGRYAEAMARVARSMSPRIPLIGEVYVNADRTLTASIPEGCGAVLVVNAGYGGIIPRKLMELVGSVTDLPGICLVVGPVPYWATRNAHLGNWSVKDGWKVKHEIERRFVGGAMGTLTLFGDGSDGRQYGGRSIPDGLTQVDEEAETEESGQ